MATVEMSFTPLPVHVRTARLLAHGGGGGRGAREGAPSRARGDRWATAPAEPVRIELTGTDGRFEVVVIDAADRDDEYEDGAAGPGGGNGLSGPGNGLPGGGLPRDSLAGEALPADGLPADGVPADGVPAGGLAGGGPPAEGRPGDPEALLPQGLGLAVIAGLADDVKIIRTAGGLSIRMSWPSGEYVG